MTQQPFIDDFDHYLYYEFTILTLIDDVRRRKKILFQDLGVRPTNCWNPKGPYN